MSQTLWIHQISEDMRHPGRWLPQQVNLLTAGYTTCNVKDYKGGGDDSVELEVFGGKRDVADMAMAVVDVMLMFLKGMMIHLYALFSLYYIDWLFSHPGSPFALSDFLPFTNFIRTVSLQLNLADVDSLTLSQIHFPSI